MMSRSLLFFPKSSSLSGAVVAQRRCIASSSSLLYVGLRSFATAFRVTSVMKRTTKAGIGGVLLLLAVSDPVISAYEESSFGGAGLDENSSYWMASWLAGRGASNNSASQQTTDVDSGESRSWSERRSNNNDGDSNKAVPPPLPTYSKVVVVGGGLAGLHTALALAERTFDPSTQIAHPPPSKRSWRRLLWPFQRAAKSPPTTNNNDANIIILEASKIGIGASGRSMGWVGHGYQVPHKNICANAIDAPIVNNYSIPAIIRSFQSLLYNFGVTEMPPPQRYTISVADRLHALSIEAMDRVRDIVIKYNIDCDWTEGGAVHGLLYDKQKDHEGEEGMLTVSQVNQIMGRNNDTNNNNNNDGNGLYKSGGYDMTCGAVNPLRLTLGLADAVDKWGVQIYEQTKVIKLQRRSEDDTKGKYSIMTNDGHIIHCDHVVLCTGAGTMSSDISRRLSYSFLPFYTWMTATEPQHEECPIKDTSLVNVVGGKFDKQQHQRLVRRRGEKEDRPAPPTYGDDHIILNYWRTNDYIASGTTSDNSEGRILFGSLGDTYPFPQWLASWRLRSAMSEIYPKFANVNFDYIWGGKLAMAINPMPLIGRDIDFDDAANNTQNGSIACDGGSKLTEGGVWYATAFAGHGIIPTAVAGSLIANAILGISDHQEWKLFQTYFPPSTWNGYPFSRLGAGAVLSLYNTFDWLAKRGVPTPPLPDLW